MSFIKKVAPTNGTYVNIFSGVEDTGRYEVLFIDGANQIYLSSSTSSGTDGIHLGSLTPTGQLRFVWDSAIPLYVYANGTGLYVKVLVTKSPSVGLSVDCS